MGQTENTERPAIRRLDVVQIDPEHDPRFGGCFMVVTKITPDGPYGYIEIPGHSVPEGVSAIPKGDRFLAYYICPADKCQVIGKAEWVPKDEIEEDKGSGGIPFIAYSGSRLAKLPSVSKGDMVECTDCGGEHELFALGEDESSLFYKCNDRTKLGAVGGKLVVGVKPTLSGD